MRIPEDVTGVWETGPFCQSTWLARVSLPGESFLVVPRKSRLLVTSEARDSKEWAYCLHGMQMPPPGMRRLLSPEQLAHAMETGNIGRCIMWSSIRAERYPYLDFYFSFGANGTGRFWASDFMPSEEDVVFTWSPTVLGLTDPAQILRHPIQGFEAQWQAFCFALLESQIEPQIADPWISRSDLKDEPLTFLVGSEAELQHVTRWICHTDAEHFAGSEWGIVRYHASGPEKPGGIVHYATDEKQLSPNQNNMPPRLKALFTLAFEYNAFTGQHWEYQDGSGLRLSNWGLEPEVVSIKVDPPSAHERAEAIVELAEWLDGKVSESEQRALLGMDVVPNLSQYMQSTTI